MHSKPIVTSVVFCALAGLPLVAQDWSMWGGTPERNMTSAVKGLPHSWDVRNGTNIKWTAQIGTSANGNPVVADGKIFLGTNNGNPRNPEITGDKGVLMCFRESDGQFLWQAVTDKMDSGDNDWPEEGVCSSPAVEGKRLYYVTNRGELVCLDTEGFTDGENDGPFQDEGRKGSADADIVWKLDMPTELGTAHLFMASSAPVLWEDLVFVETSNGRDSNGEAVIAPKAPSFIAVSKDTGEREAMTRPPGGGLIVAIVALASAAASSRADRSRRASRSQVFWHIDRFDSGDAARAAAGPASIAFEAERTSVTCSRGRESALSSLRFRGAGSR